MGNLFFKPKGDVFYESKHNWDLFGGLHLTEYWAQENIAFCSFLVVPKSNLS